VSETAAGIGWRPGAALVVAAAFFMEQLDGTILVTASPRIAADFGVSAADINITMTAYLITVATAIPIGGWLASRFGARAVFLAAIVVFVGASALCAASSDLTALTASRVLQGLGGALMVPVGRLVILRTARREDLLRAIAYITWPGLLAPVLAPLVGGIITTYLGWQWIFLVNVPIGAAVTVFALLLIRDSARDRSRLDWLGLVLTTVAIFSLIGGMELVAGTDEMPLAVAALAGAAVFGAASILWLLRASTPLLELRVFAIGTFRAGNAGGSLFRLAISGAPFLLPLLFQDAFGWSPIQSGLLVTAVFIGNVAIKPATTPLLRRFGFRTVLLASTLAAAACFALFLTFTAATPLPIVFAVLLVSGIVRSVGFSAYNTVQFADVPPETLGSANTLSATLTQLAAALGIAVAALCVRLLSVPGAEGIPVAPAAAYDGAFIVLGVACVGAFFGAVLLPRDAAAHVSARTTA
jgi:EmrB/QacA subfamily drug resistance transporter